MERVVAELRSENVRLKRSVDSLKLAQAKAKQAADAEDAAVEDIQEAAPVALIIPPPPKDPESIIVTAAEATPLSSEEVPVESTPRLVEPSFASVESVFENEANNAAIPTTSILYGVHLTSYRKEEELIAGWRVLQRENPDQLGLLEPRVERVTFEDRGEFLRLIAGGFSSKEKAIALCDRLKRRNVYCAVTDFTGDRVEISPSG